MTLEFQQGRLRGIAEACDERARELAAALKMIENLTARNDSLEALRAREREAVKHLLERLTLEFRVVAGIDGVEDVWVADVNAAWLGACHVPLDLAHARILTEYISQKE